MALQICSVQVMVYSLFYSIDALYYEDGSTPPMNMEPQNPSSSGEVCLARLVLGSLVVYGTIQGPKYFRIGGCTLKPNILGVNI